MKRKDIIFICCMILTVLLTCAVGIKANAFSKPTELEAVGDFTLDKDGSGIAGDHPSDVVILAEDFYYLYELCK